MRIVPIFSSPLVPAASQALGKLHCGAKRQRGAGLHGRRQRLQRLSKNLQAQAESAAMKNTADNRIARQICFRNMDGDLPFLKVELLQVGYLCW
jgi:hypothetical protein